MSCLELAPVNINKVFPSNLISYLKSRCLQGWLLSNPVTFIVWAKEIDIVVKRFYIILRNPLMSSFSKGKIFPDKATETALDTTPWQYHIHFKWSFSEFPERDHRWSPGEDTCQNTFSFWHETWWLKTSSYSLLWLTMRIIKVTISYRESSCLLSHRIIITNLRWLLFIAWLTVDINRENSDSSLLLIFPTAFPDPPTHFFPLSEQKSASNFCLGKNSIW